MRKILLVTKAVCFDPAETFLTPIKDFSSKHTCTGSQASAMEPVPRAPCAPCPQEKTSPESTEKN